MGLGLPTASLIGLAVYYSFEAGAMSALIAVHLPTGSTVTRTLAFLDAPPMRQFQRDHDLTPVQGATTSPVRVSRYDDRVDGWQAYPGGQVVRVWMDSEPWGKTMTLTFIYDGRGRLVRYSASEEWAGI